MEMPTASTSPFVSSVMTLAFQNVAYPKVSPLSCKKADLSLCTSVISGCFIVLVICIAEAVSTTPANSSAHPRRSGAFVSPVRQAAITGAPSVISGIQYRFRYSPSSSTNDSAVIAALIASVSAPKRSTSLWFSLAAFSVRASSTAAAAGSNSAPTLTSPCAESSTLRSL